MQVFQRGLALASVLRGVWFTLRRYGFVFFDSEKVWVCAVDVVINNAILLVRDSSTL